MKTRATAGRCLELGLGAALALWAARGSAEVPQRINYQGRVVAGTNLLNGVVSLVVRIYTNATAGDCLFADSNSVTVVDGLYSAEVGEHPIQGTLTNALASGQAYLEVTMDGQTLLPRERIGSVAYALGAQQAGLADNAALLGGRPPSAFATGTPVYVESDPRFAVWTNTDFAAFVEQVAYGLGSLHAENTNHAALTTNAHGGIVAFNDYRLTNARPALAHVQAWATITDAPDFATNPVLRVEVDPLWIAAEPAYLKTDGTRAMAGTLNMGGYSITNLATNSLVFNDGTAVGLAQVQNWNAAYGWGNHAAAGYITGSASSNSFVKKSGDTMTGVLTINVGAGNELSISNAGSSVRIGGGAQVAAQAVAVGANADAGGSGVAVGYQANGNNGGAALGRMANGYNFGAAAGSSANGVNQGSALGYQANASAYGVAAGEEASAINRGVAVGWQARGTNYNVAIGCSASAPDGGERLALGHNVTNLVDNSAAVRGTLYLDGGTGIFYRAAFGIGPWTNLLAGLATGTPVYVETDPVWQAEKAGYATGTPLYAESDPLWRAASNGFYTKVAADARFATGTPVYAESDPLYAASVAAAITAGMTQEWTAAYGWGNHATAGYIAGAGASNSFVQKSGDTMMGTLNMGTRTIVNVSRVDFAAENISIGQAANSTSYGSAVGHGAESYWYGAAVGIGANAFVNGAAVGAYASAKTSGAALGRNAQADTDAVAVGGDASGSQYGVAVGYNASGPMQGTAVGYGARGANGGVVVGALANGYNGGAALGFSANGAATNVAIGYQANAAGGFDRVAIGRAVVNAADNSAALRGSLYLDGGTGIFYRAAFGAGPWTNLLAGLATGTPVYAESDPIWQAEKAGYATGTPVYAEADPVWSAASNGYYTKLQADGRFATGTPLYAESDPVYGGSAAAAITASMTQNWTAAYGWGNHAAAGYVTGVGASNSFVRKSGDTMTGILTVQTNISLNYSADRGMGSRSLLTIGGGDDVEIGHLANGYIGGTAVGRGADADWYGTALGRDAKGDLDGTAVGCEAQGDSEGAAVGRSAMALAYGAAVGRSANAFDYGAAVGRSANGGASGAAVGASANGSDNGAAIGRQANGRQYGAAVGRMANGSEYGLAFGSLATGSRTNIAIGYQASATGGTCRVAVGLNLTNAVDNSAALRGSLYLDGGTGIFYRAAFGAGPWTNLLAGLATGTPVYAESDPVWAAASNGYYTKVQSDARFATGTPLYAESDPVYGGSAAAAITAGMTQNWTAAYGWGNHAAAGYIAGAAASNSFVKKAGDTMTGLLALPAGGLTVGASQLVAWTNGCVGIGIANPTNALAVNGTIKAKEVIVTLDGWPDFVFAEDYRPMPLDQVEQYIRANGHLPGVPSAAEVAAGGVKLGEMQAILLQKVEELTLHVIELEKQNAELRARVAGSAPRR